MKSLLEYIQGESGELDKYWNIVEKQNDDARKAARRLEKERRKLEMGSDYESSDNEQQKQEYYTEDVTYTIKFNNRDTQNQIWMIWQTMRTLKMTQCQWM